jgi:glycosyltransferase involved in cell wall biosynthesis
MKVVYVSSIPSGGPVSHLLDLAPKVAEAGVEVKVVCFDEAVATQFSRLGIEASAIPLRNKLDIPGAARARRELKGADIVHTHDRRSGLLVRPQARHLGARAVHTLHGVPDELWVTAEREHVAPPPGVSRARLAWLRYGVLRIEALLSHLGAVVVPSQALARYLIGHGFPARRITVIPNGIELTRSEPQPAHDPVAIGTAAILEYRKGIDLLIEACARLRSPYRLEIFGGGSLREQLEEQARRLGVEARFHGFVTDVRARLDEIDLFVLPTRADNMPIALLEAMACALPVVATNVGGIPEIVADGETGILVEPDDAGALARAIGHLLEDPSRRERLGRKGAARIGEHFEAHAVARRMVDLYERL